MPILDDLLDAIIEQNTDGVRELLSNSDINPSKGNNEALLRGCESSNEEIVALLLDWRGEAGQRIDPSIQSNKALSLARQVGNQTIIDMLTTNPRVQFFEACKNNDVKAVQALLSNPTVDPRVDRDQALRISTRLGHADITAQLLAYRGANQERCNPASVINEALVNTIDKNPEQFPLIYEAFCEQHGDPSLLGNKIFDLAKAKGLTLIQEKLLKDPRVAYLDAIKTGNTAKFQYYRENPLVQTLKSQECFNLACESNQSAIARLLLAADPTIDPTPAMIPAARHNDLNFLAELLEDPRTKPTTNHYETLRYSAISKEARLLIFSHPDIFFMDAAKCGDTETMLTYLEHAEFSNRLREDHRRFAPDQYSSEVQHLMLRHNALPYFATGNAEVDRSRRKAFTMVPMLYDLCGFRSETVTLPNDLQEGIDKGNWRIIEDYFGLEIKTIKNIPSSDNPDLPSSITLALLQHTILKPEDLPTLPKGQKLQKEWSPKQNEANKKLFADRKAFNKLLLSCFTLSEELGFRIPNRNNPATYPPFLTTLIKQTVNESRGHWQEASKVLPLPQHKTLAILNDFINTAIIPNRDLNNANKTTTQLEEFIEVLGEGMGIAGYSKLIKAYDSPGNLGKRLKVKAASLDEHWDRLYEGTPSYSVDGKKIRAILLTSREEIEEESNKQEHSVGNYSRQALFTNHHFISLRDDEGRTLSTIMVEIASGPSRKDDERSIALGMRNDFHIIVRQHFGYKNATPGSLENEALKLFKRDLETNTVKTKPETLVASCRRRQEQYINDPRLRVGYDTNNPSEVSNAVETYRSIAKDVSERFCKNIDKTLGVKKDLIAEEEKEDTAKRRKPRRTNSQEPESGIQKILNKTFGDEIVSVSIDAPKAGNKFGDIVLILESPSLDAKKIQAKLRDTLQKIKGCTVSIEDNNTIRIQGATPRPVEQLLKKYIKIPNSVKDK